MLHFLLLAGAGLKALDLFRPESWRRLGAPAHPGDLVGFEQRRAAYRRLERGMWGFSLAAAVYPLIGLAGTVLEMSVALGQLGAGLRADGLSIPLGQALRYTFHGIVGSAAALCFAHLFQRRLQILAHPLDDAEAGNAR